MSFSIFLPRSTFRFELLALLHQLMALKWQTRRHQLGRPEKDQDLIQLIRRIWSANPTWVSSRIRDELAKLGLWRDRDSIYHRALPHRSLSKTLKRLS